MGARGVAHRVAQNWRCALPAATSALCVQERGRGMRYKDIKDFTQRCEEHPDHQTGMVTNLMIQARLVEEIDELREYIETKLREKNK